MPPTPVIPVPPPRWARSASLADTPPPTVRLAGTSPPPPPPAYGSSGADSCASSFVGGVGAGPGPRMPELGEEVGGFRLVEELGRGTFGRVFLARQGVLAGRPVALKVTLRPNREAERLARLQHTNVVPVHSVHAVGSVQLICMPFLGRLTLADALKTYRASAGSSHGWSKKATRAQRGSTTVTTGARPHAPAAPAAAVAPAVAAPGLVGDPDAVLRLLVQLAAGLAHAHGRGVLHLDIKPGNVLLADSGEPMLLDFNLSVDAAEADRELVGGTVPYMAPEQLLDMKSRGRGGVDARTDLYALGVVAYELLTGETPFPGAPRSLADFDKLLASRAAGPAPLRPRNAAVTPAVEAIVRKLLAPDPAARYQTAEELRDDVERQIADRPLRFAPDRSVAERARKWRRRNPRLLVAGLVALVVFAAGGTGVAAVQAADGRADAEARLKADAALARMHGLRLDFAVPDEPMALARGVARARELFREYGVLDDPAWQERDAVRRLPAEVRAELTGDVGEVLTLLAANRLLLARGTPGPEADAARDEATACVRAAAACFADADPPPALSRVARDLGLDAAAPAPAVAARDHFLDAADHARAGRHAEAVAALEEATLLDPGHAAAHYLLGHELGTLGRSERAAERHALATGLMKTDPRTHAQWGSAELSGGHPERAVRILDRATRLPSGPTPDLRFLTGIARLKLGRYAEARSDLSTAVTAGVRPVSALLARADAADRLGDPAAAAADRRAALALPGTNGVSLVERARLRESTDPDGARADYAAAVALGGAGTVEAYRGLIALDAERPGRTSDLLRAAEEAAGRYPTRAEFHAARALFLARLGKHAGAREAVERAARSVPTPDDAFRIAGAMARSPEDADRAAALQWLRRAYLGGVRDLARYDAATDLDGVRASETYAAFRAAAAVIGR